MKKTFFLALVFAVFVAVSCKKPVQSGDLTINIDYSVNGKALITDTLCYQNEVGNKFMITEIQWFISKMELQNEQGKWVELEPRIFYIDTNIPENQTLRIASIPIGKYKTLRFTFGLDEADNQTGIYSDPPESTMFWPEPLGGGYHYMKLNGKFVDANGQLVPLNVHLGIGQNADHSEFYQNYFTVEDPIDLSIAENTENQFNLCMIVDNWFRNPNLYDFNELGSAIMQNQAAQQALKENGKDVFTWYIPEKQNDMTIKKEEIVEDFNHFMQKAAPKPHFWTWENVKQTLEQIKENNKSRS
jgi:hypothetical protein